MLEYINFLNKSYINFVAPSLKIFKLNKAATEKDLVYGEEKFSRLYLPPFDIRGFHLDNSWRQLLGGILPYREEEDNIQFVVNFENMVQTIRTLKYLHIANLHITYTGKGTPTATNASGIFTLKVDGTTVGVFTLSNINYNTALKLGNAISNLTNFTATIDGQNDSSSNLINFAEINFKNRELLVYSTDTSYTAITDVIEAGDLVLTNKWRLYEVLNCNPGGDFGWDWVTYVMSCNLARMDQCVLPGNYNEQIKNHQFNITQRINME
jgi:hypothetical protein